MHINVQSYGYCTDGSLNVDDHWIEAFNKPKENDIVKVKLDCQEWSVTFTLNDEQLGDALQIAKSKWYPFINVQKDVYGYKVIA